ncbi:uncharacterized protein G2W53_000996 [Senna tora]|uniref:Uncharacterized protein n=1 Tax=Senna tora TaxID=362788 RepID=A0A835CI81_9FABA|nr:uncharacterized protein G2W53_000996 [Senna tora]
MTTDAGGRWCLLPKKGFAKPLRHIVEAEDEARAGVDKGPSVRIGEDAHTHIVGDSPTTRGNIKEGDAKDGDAMEFVGMIFVSLICLSTEYSVDWDSLEEGTSGQGLLGASWLMHFTVKLDQFGHVDFFQVVRGNSDERCVLKEFATRQASSLPLFGFLCLLGLIFPFLGIFFFIVREFLCFLDVGYLLVADTHNKGTVGLFHCSKGIRVVDELLLDGGTCVRSGHGGRFVLPWSCNGSGLGRVGQGALKTGCPVTYGGDSGDNSTRCAAAFPRKCFLGLLDCFLEVMSIAPDLQMTNLLHICSLIPCVFLTRTLRLTSLPARGHRGKGGHFHPFHRFPGEFPGVQAGPGIGLEAKRNSVSFKHDGSVAKLDRHEPDSIPGKVEDQLKKPPDNWTKKKVIKADDKVMKVVKNSGKKDGKER